MPAFYTVVGLDVGHHTVKVVCAQRRGKTHRFTHAEMLRLPAEATDKTDVIGRWLDKLGLLKHHFVIGMSGQSCMFQPLTVAADDPRSDDQIAAVEIHKFNELASETTTYGFAPLRVEGRDKRLVLAMVRPAVLDATLMLPRSLSLDVVDIVPSPVAVFNGLAAMDPSPDAPAIVADIGHIATEVAVGGGAGLMFARTFAAGGQLFTQAVSKAAGLPYRQAENVKETRSALGQGDEVTRGSLAKAADIWLSELDVCLTVLKTHYPSDADRPRRILLAGGGSELGGLGEYVRARTGLEVVPVSKAPGTPLADAASRYLLGAGLALSGLDRARSPISVLPVPMRDDLVFKRQKKYWGASGAAAALILGVSLFGGYRDSARMERQLNTQRESLRRCQQLAADIDALKRRNDLVLKMIEPVEIMLRDGPLLRDAISTVASYKDPDDWITMISDADSYFTGKRVARQGQPAPDPATQKRPLIADPKTGLELSSFRRLIIEGYTVNPSLSVLKSLISSMRGASIVQSVDLIGDEELVADPERDKKWENVGRHFVIDLRTQLPPADTSDGHATQ